MGAGSGALGFGGGLAKGLAAGLMRNQDIKRQEAQKEEARKAREFGLIEPVLMRDALETGDFTSYVSALSQYNPDLAKQFKKENPFEMLAPILSGKAGQPGQTPEADPSAGPDYLSGQTGQPAAGEARQPVQTPGAPQQPRWTFGGATLRSNPEREAAGVEAKVMLARRMLPILQQADPTATMDDAMAAVGIRTPSAAARSGSRAILSDFLATKAQEKGGALTSAEQAAAIKEFEALNDSTKSLGVYAEAAAGELGFSSAEAARAAGKMAEVNKRATELAAGRAGSTTTARGEAAAKAPLTTKQRFDALADLQTAWRKADAPQREMKRQFGLMETALGRFEKDPVGTVEAIRVTFEKILDPNSVVREGEYARQGYGLSLLQRLEGYKQQIVDGGGNIPKPVLDGMVETARAFLEGQEGWNDLERERITSTAKEFGLNPDRVFGTPAAQATDRARTTPAAAPKPWATAAPAAPAAGAKPSTGGTGIIMRDGKMYKDGQPWPPPR